MGRRREGNEGGKEWALFVLDAAQQPVGPFCIRDPLFLHYGDQSSARISEPKAPLNMAANWGYLPIVEMLINHGASLSDRGEDGMTVLHDVVVSARVEESEDALIGMMTLLVEHGAEFDAVDDKGATPLHLACVSRIEYIIAYLLSIGSCRTLKNAEGMTPQELYLTGDWYTEENKLPVLASTLASLHTD
jgi:ankyrin repeat protein